MGVLELLIGKPLDLCTDEELDDWVIKGRLARELESQGAKTGRKKSGSGKKKIEIPDFELIDEDVPEFELEDD